MSGTSSAVLTEEEWEELNEMVHEEPSLAALETWIAKRDAAREESLRNEIARLVRWKAEALPIIAGLQELGRVMGLPVGVLVTGEMAKKKAIELVAANATLPRRMASRIEEAASVGREPATKYGEAYGEGYRDGMTHAARIVKEGV